MISMERTGFEIPEAFQKECHPVLDTGSPILDIGRRCRIGVRHDSTNEK